eukprot:5604254-Pyramimonas_sp.AAC.1
MSPTPWIGMYPKPIDDISLHSVGGPQTVARELSFAVKETVGLLQARGLPLSWDKMVFCAATLRRSA